MKRRLLLCLFIACFVTGCSSQPVGGAAESGDVPERLEKLVIASTEKKDWTAPAASSRPANDKLIVAVTAIAASESIQLIEAGVQDAVRSLGWEYKTIDAAGDQNKMNAGIDSAVTLGADAIILDSIDPKLVKNSIAQAREAGVAVVSINGTGGIPFEVTATTIQADETFPAYEQGYATGAKICVDTDGAGQVALFPNDEFAGAVERMRGVREGLSECPAVKIVKEAPFTVSELSTSLTVKVKSLLQANPTVNAVAIPGDYSALDVITAITEAGYAEKVAVYSFDGNAQQMDWLRKGNIIASEAVVGLEWQGWAAVDNLNRLFNSTPVVQQKIPFRLLTKDTAPSSGGYQGDVNYEAEYLKAWGIAK